MSVPIDTSPGRSGFGPQRALSYHSGPGNIRFGFGWRLSLPSITRKTDKGLRQYRDAEDSNLCILSDAEDRGSRVSAGYRVPRYRSRTEDSSHASSAGPVSAHRRISHSIRRLGTPEDAGQQGIIMIRS
jgi:hypothetical protein